jgi:Holliday junction resolvase RusA-like endonuclease
LGRKKRAFTPETTLEWERHLAEEWDGPFFEGPVSMEVQYHKDHVVITIEDLPEERRSRLRGDVDNYEKIVLDALNGVAYEDDRQVVRLLGEKLW